MQKRFADEKIIVPAALTLGWLADMGGLRVTVHTAAEVLFAFQDGEEV